MRTHETKALRRWRLISDALERIGQAPAMLADVYSFVFTPLTPEQVAIAVVAQRTQVKHDRRNA